MAEKTFEGATKMKQTASLIWLMKCIRKRIPALFLMTAVHVLQAIFGVLFVLGTRNVIDSAVAKAQEPFYKACFYQGAVILGILICLTVFMPIPYCFDYCGLVI